VEVVAGEVVGHRRKGGGLERGGVEGVGWGSVEI